MAASTRWHTLVRDLFLLCWIRIQFRSPVAFFFFRPNPTLTLTLTLILTDDRPPIEVALV